MLKQEGTTPWTPTAKSSWPSSHSPSSDVTAQP